MKLYDEEQELSIHADFTKSKSDFLDQVKVEVYESEEGVACVKFHDVIVSLTKVYIGYGNDESVIEEKVHTVLGIRTDFP